MSINLLQKKEICFQKKQKPVSKNYELAIEFKCDKSIILDILKQSEK